MPCPWYNFTSERDWSELVRHLGRRHDPDHSVVQSVESILQAVVDQGDHALVSYTRQFDCPDFETSQIKVPLQGLEQAMHNIPKADLALIEEAATNIREFHVHQKEHSWVDHSTPGLITGQLVRPMARAGLYIPGGTSGDTPLVSSLLMNAIPAQVAGVERIAVVSPPRQDGTINPYTLAAAASLGLREVYAVGSAWAVAALGYGTESIPRVDVITGPGNIYVTTAKRLLAGQVAIDLIAGPSEIAILADESAHPEWMAADLLSQAEHDPLASALLISPDYAILESTREALQEQLHRLPRQDTAALALKQWGGLVHVPDLEAAVHLINTLAPEHLELCLDDPWAWLSSIHNAGAIFLGHYTPEPIGDYFAGPNHVLPTMGSARFASALSVQNFMKKSSMIAATKSYSQRNADKVARLARLEGLEAHARSAEIRHKG
ncbi:MAG: histidinol dehydrogenase [Desulfovermiculus sp.]|nr:histidinol dehydrogenase [Desulfovermiculus sp.]